MSDGEIDERARQNASRVQWRIRTAMTKIHRAEMEWGFGNVDELRNTRGRMRAAQTLLRHARVELLGIDSPGPATRGLTDSVEGLLLTVASHLAHMDISIAEWEAEARP